MVNPPKKKQRLNKKNWKQYASTAGRVLRTASKALSLARFVASIVNAEKKKYDATYTNVSMGTTGAVSTGAFNNMCYIAQGGDIHERGGNSILVKGVAVNGVMYTRDVAECRARMMIIQDTQQQEDTNPVLSDVLDANADSFTEALLNDKTPGRFKVLRNKNYIFSAATSKTRKIKEYVKLHTHVKYNGSTGADIQKNGIYILFFSSVAESGTDTPVFLGMTRTYYYDN